MCVKYGARHEQTTAPLKTFLVSQVLHGGNKSTRQILNIFLKGDFKHNKTLDNITPALSNEPQSIIYRFSSRACHYAAFHDITRQKTTLSMSNTFVVTLSVGHPCTSSNFLCHQNWFLSPVISNFYAYVHSSVNTYTHSKSSMASFSWGQQSAQN